MSETAEFGDKELPLELRQALVKVRENLEKISSGLTGNDPLLPTHCSAIHAICKEHEELVHILSVQEIRKLMAGMKAYQQLSLIKETAGKKTRGKVTLDSI